MNNDASTVSGWCRQRQDAAPAFNKAEEGYTIAGTRELFLVIEGSTPLLRNNSSLIGALACDDAYPRVRVTSPRPGLPPSPT
jgi:hypothetical protein